MQTIANPDAALSVCALLLALLPVTIRRWPTMFGVFAGFALIQSVVAYRLSAELGAASVHLIVPPPLIVPPLVLAIVIAARTIVEAIALIGRAWLRRHGFRAPIAVCPAPLPFADDARA